MLRRHQHVQQRHHVLHLAAINQLGFLANLSGNVQRAQRVLHWCQAGTLARQHHDVLRLERALPCSQLVRNPGGSLACLQRTQGRFRKLAGRGQAVAPGGIILRRVGSIVIIVFNGARIGTEIDRFARNLR